MVGHISKPARVEPNIVPPGGNPGGTIWSEKHSAKTKFIGKTELQKNDGLVCPRDESRGNIIIRVYDSGLGAGG